MSQYQCTFLKLPRLAILLQSASFCFYGDREIHFTDEVLVLTRIFLSLIGSKSLIKFKLKRRHLCEYSFTV